MPVPGPWHDDVLPSSPQALTAGRSSGRGRGSVRARRSASAPAPSGLPFAPRSFRDFSLRERHTSPTYVASPPTGSGGQHPRPPLRHAVAAMHGRPLPAGDRTHVPGAQAGARLLRAPVLLPPQPHVVRRRRRGRRLCAAQRVPRLRELELGAVLVGPVRDYTPQEGRAAIGGFVVVNGWTARDGQWADTRSSPFGGAW